MNFIPYPPPGRHNVIGDRRSAAIVAADGTVSWLCLPRFDGAPVFGALLDAERGGFWRLGPAATSLGTQRCGECSCSLVTTWSDDDSELELIDTMLVPPGRDRAIIRRLRCTRGAVTCAHAVEARQDFGAPARAQPADGAMLFELEGVTLRLRVFGAAPQPSGDSSARFTLRAGQVAWAVLSIDSDAIRSIDDARAALVAADAYWNEASRLAYTGPRRERVMRSNLLIQLLTYEPSAAVIAAPTASVPERIGGDWNADYRFSWIRDTSLSLAVLAVLGNTESARRYMDWLTTLVSPDHAPLQVLYRVDGATQAPQRERRDIAGYRGSLPVRLGNHAYRQLQHDAFGFLCDCALIYLEQRAPWKESYWRLIERAADHLLATWRQPDNGIWELGEKRHYVSGKVMAWVALDRSVKIARRLGRDGAGGRWVQEMQRIHDEVMARGWSERLQSFRQRYDDDTLDASSLLVSVMGFLPPDHPRVLSTIARVESELAVDGFVYRFDPATTVENPLPLGEYEAAFLPCTFWLATAHAKAGRPDRAERILERIDRIAPDAWLPEAVDPRDMAFRGNFPLLFSQIEYVRAAMETAKAKPLQRVELLPGKALRTAQKLLGARRAAN